MAPQPSFNPKTIWKNFHESWEQAIVGEWDVFMPQQAAGLSVEDLKETTAPVPGADRRRPEKGAEGARDRLELVAVPRPGDERLDAQHQPAARPAEGLRPRISTPAIPAAPTRRTASTSSSAATPSPT